MELWSLWSLSPYQCGCVLQTESSPNPVLLGFLWRLPHICLVAMSCLTLCNPMYCGLPGPSVHGDSPGKNTRLGCHALLQGIVPNQGSNPGLPYCEQIIYCLSHLGSPRILEWVAYPFSRSTSRPRNQTRVSCIVEDSLLAELPGRPFPLIGMLNY